MFWGLVLEPSRSYAQVVDTPFHVSMAALDLKNSDNQEDASTLILRQDNTEYVLANLSKKHKIFNIPLGLDFDIGEEIEFFVQGQSQIHLTGFLAGDDNDDLDEMEDEDSDVDVSHKAKDIKKAEATKRKLKDNTSSNAKKLKIFDESLDDDTDEDDYTLDEDDLEDLDEEDSDEESEDVSDEASPPVKKEQKPQQQQKQANNVQSPSKKKKKNKLNQGNQPGKPNQQQHNKQNNQQQGNKQGNQQQKNHLNPKSPQKNQQNNKTPQKTPQAKTPQLKTPQTGNKQQNAKSPQGNSNPSKQNKKVINGGIIIEDIIEGKGKVASSSKKVGVYYVGRLAWNKKEFDKNISGKPFNFNLGRGEVIKGWDLGLDGMREGGKRKITIPAKFAYGQSGAPPSIPPNSTLEFEVSLVNVK